MSNMMGKDPFANDPFFNNDFGSGMFCRADEMMNKMRNQMSDMPDPGSLGKGQFMMQSTKIQTKMDKNGRPVNEVYQTKAHGANGGGNRIVDRQ